MITKNLLQQLGAYIESVSDKSPLWEIQINDKRISFEGKRLFASKGAAKTALTNHIALSLWHLPASLRGDMKRSRWDGADRSIMDELKESGEFLVGYHDDTKLRLQAKNLSTQLIKEGIAKIIEV